MRSRSAASVRVVLLALLLTTLVACFGAAAPAGASRASLAPIFAAPGSPPPLLALLAIQQAQLTAAGGAVNDQFGYAVAIAGDTAVVGAPTDDVGANIDQGSAYVYTRSGATWSQQAQLNAGNSAAGDHFGYSVAIAGDTVVVGAIFDTIGAKTNQGSAYVYTRSGADWLPQQQLTASDGAANDQFGTSVAIAGDTAVVSAAFDAVGPNANQGSAYVYTRSGPDWTQEQKLTATDGAAYDYFGTSVAVAGDTAVAGAYFADVGANAEQGSAYVYTRSGATWSQQEKLVATDGAANDQFGYSVAIAGDTAVVGALYDDVGANVEQGSAYVFTRSGIAWRQQKLTAADGAAIDLFGYSVAIAGDTAVVGALADDVGFRADQGSAYVFTRGGSTWTQQAQLTASDGAAYDYSGYSVAIAGDSAVVGAYHDTVGVNGSQGSAYVFRITPSITTLAPAVGAIGTSVTVTGTSFGATRGTVEFDAALAVVTSWTDTRVVCRVPAGVAGKPKVVLTTATGLPSAPASFSVEPKVGAMTPARGKVGATVTITGTGFGATRGASKVYFGGKAATKYVSWSRIKIKVKVPSMAKGRKALRVKTSGGASSSKYFMRI